LRTTNDPLYSSSFLAPQLSKQTELLQTLEVSARAANISNLTIILMKPTSLLTGMVALALALLISVDPAEAHKEQDEHHHHHTNNINEDEPNIRMTLSKSHRTNKNGHNDNVHALAASEERFKSYGGSSDVFKVKSISSNKHLCSGCQACIELEGDLQGTVDQGSTIRLQVSKFFFTVYDKTFDLCAMLEMIDNGPRCPLSPNSDGLRACLPLDKSLTTDVSLFL